MDNNNTIPDSSHSGNDTSVDSTSGNWWNSCNIIISSLSRKKLFLFDFYFVFF